MLQGAIVGLATGGTYAIIAVCLTIVQRLVRVLNFALVTSAVIGGYTAAVLFGHGVGGWLSILVGLAVGTVLSAVLGFAIATWFSEVSEDRRSAVMLAFFTALLAVAFLAFGHNPRVFPTVIDGSAFSVGSVVVTKVTVVSVVVAVVVALAFLLLLARTTLGVRLLAMSERPTTASLLGLRTRPLTVLVWALAGGITTFALLLVLPQSTSDQLALGLLIIPACGAALIGRLVDVRWALAGGLALGAAQGALTQSGALRAYQQVLPFAVIIIVLLYTQRHAVWDEAR